MIFTKVQLYVAAAAVAVLTGLLGVQTWRLHVSQLATAKAVTTLATERAVASEARAIQQSNFRKTEINLGNSAAQTRKATNDQVRSLDVHSASLLQRVRNAAGAQSGDVSGTAAAPGDGQVVARSPEPELLGQLGEEDVREANRADTIRLHLAACYADYDRAKAALEALNQGSN